MKRYLIALSLTYGLTGCDYEDGKDGTDGQNGKDGQTCEIVNGGDLQCGEEVIPLRGEQGESCEIVTDQSGELLVCGEDSVRLPSSHSERSVCSSEKLDNGDFLVTCNGESFEIPSSGSIADIVELAMTPVELISSKVSVDEETVTSNLEFNVPIKLDKKQLDKGKLQLTKSGPNSVRVLSKIGKSSYSNWSLKIPGSAIANRYYSKATVSKDIALQIPKYSYSDNLESLLFSFNAYTLCESPFNLVTLDQAKKTDGRELPLLLNLINRKAYDPTSKNVVSLEPTDDIEVICIR